MNKKNCKTCLIDIYRTWENKSQWGSRAYCSRKCINVGRTPSNIAKKRMSLAKTGKPSPLKGIKRPNHIPWNKGKKGHVHTLETRERMSKTRKGKPTPWLNTKGEKNINWKGGISSSDKMERTQFRKLLQKKIFIRDDYTCQLCDQKGGYLQVDHIMSWAEHPDLRFEESNCRTLCMGCHYYVTFNRKIPIGVIWGHNLSKRITS